MACGASACGAVCLKVPLLNAARLHMDVLSKLHQQMTV